jgi:hypothetical protein
MTLEIRTPVDPVVAPTGRAAALDSALLASSQTASPASLKPGAGLLAQSTPNPRPGPAPSPSGSRSGIEQTVVNGRTVNEIRVPAAEPTPMPGPAPKQSAPWVARAIVEQRGSKYYLVGYVLANGDNRTGVYYTQPEVRGHGPASVGTDLNLNALVYYQPGGTSSTAPPVDGRSFKFDVPAQEIKGATTAGQAIAAAQRNLDNGTWSVDNVIRNVTGKSAASMSPVERLAFVLSIAIAKGTGEGVQSVYRQFTTKEGLAEVATMLALIASPVGALVEMGLMGEMLLSLGVDAGKFVIAMGMAATTNKGTELMASADLATNLVANLTSTFLTGGILKPLIGAARGVRQKTSSTWRKTEDLQTSPGSGGANNIVPFTRRGNNDGRPGTPVRRGGPSGNPPGGPVGSTYQVRLGGQIFTVLRESAAPPVTHNQGPLVRAMQNGADRSGQATALAWADGAWLVDSLMRSDPVSFKALTQLGQGETVKLVRAMGGYNLDVYVTGTEAGGRRGGTLAITVVTPWGGKVSMRPTVGSPSQPLEISDTVRAAEAVRNPRAPATQQRIPSVPRTSGTSPRAPAIDGIELWSSQTAFTDAYGRGNGTAQALGRGLVRTDVALAADGTLEDKTRIRKVLGDLQRNPGTTALIDGVRIRFVGSTEKGQVFEVGVPGQSGKAGITITAKGKGDKVTGWQLPDTLPASKIRAAEGLSPQAPPANDGIQLWTSQTAFTQAYGRGNGTAQALGKGLVLTDSALAADGTLDDSNRTRIRQVLGDLQRNPGKTALIDGVRIRFVGATEKGQVFEVGVPGQSGKAGITITAQGKGDKVTGWQLPDTLPVSKIRAAEGLNPQAPANDGIQLWSSQRAFIDDYKGGNAANRARAQALGKVLVRADMSLSANETLTSGKTMRGVLAKLQANPGSTSTVGGVRFKFVSNTSNGPVFEVGLAGQTGPAGVTITAKGSGRKITGLQLPAGLPVQDIRRALGQNADAQQPAEGSPKPTDSSKPKPFPAPSVVLDKPKPFPAPSQVLNQVDVWPSDAKFIEAYQAGDARAKTVGQALVLADNALRNNTAVVAGGQPLREVLGGLQKNRAQVAKIDGVQYRFVGNSAKGPVFEIGIPGVAGESGVRVTAQVKGNNITGLSLPKGLPVAALRRALGLPTAEAPVKQINPGIEELPNGLWKKLREYGLGEKTREEVLKDLTPAQRKQLERALDELDKADKTVAPPGSTPEVDKTKLGQIKALRRFRDIFEQQRVADYAAGRSTREQALAGLQGRAAQRVAKALEAIDRNRVSGGNGGVVPVQYDPLRLAEAINAHVKEFGSALGLSAALVAELRDVLRRGIATTTDQAKRDVMTSALDILIQQTALAKAPPDAPASQARSGASAANFDDLPQLFLPGANNRDINTSKALAVIPLLVGAKLDKLLKYLDQHVRDVPIDRVRVDAAVAAQRAKLQKPVSADEAKALVAKRFEVQMSGMDPSEREAMVDKLRLLADLESAQADSVSPLLSAFLFELDRIQVETARVNGVEYVAQRLSSLLGSQNDGQPLGGSTRNSAKQRALMEYMRSRHPDVVREIENNRSLPPATLASVVMLMQEFGGWDGKTGAQDLSRLGQNALANARQLANEQASPTPQIWIDAFERYAAINPGNAAFIKQTLAKSRYQPQDLVRTAVKYAGTTNADPRMLAVDMAKHTQAHKVALARSNLINGDIVRVPDTDYFEAQPGNPQTRVREMNDKLGQDIALSNKPTNEEWLGLADFMVDNYASEVPEIKAILLEIWRNGGKFNGPQLQIADLAKSFKSKALHALVKTPTAADLLKEAKYLLNQAQKGKLSAQVRPMDLTDSDRLRPGVIDYRFPEAPLQARQSDASMSPAQRSAELTQARLAMLKEEGKLLLARLMATETEVQRLRLSAQGKNEAATAALARLKAEHPEKTASNDLEVATLTAQARATRLQMNHLDRVLEFIALAEQALPTASPNDVKDIFKRYEGLLNSTLRAGNAELRALRAEFPLGATTASAPQLSDFLIDAELQTNEQSGVVDAPVSDLRARVVEKARKEQMQVAARRLQYPKGDSRRPELDVERGESLSKWAEAAAKASRLGSDEDQLPPLRGR